MQRFRQDPLGAAKNMLDDAVAAGDQLRAPVLKILAAAVKRDLECRAEARASGRTERVERGVAARVEPY